MAVTPGTLLGRYRLIPPACEIKCLNLDHPELHPPCDIVGRHQLQYLVEDL